MNRRRCLRTALLGAAAPGLLLGGCVSIGGGDAPARVWYQLTDRGGSAAAPSAAGPSMTAGPSTAAGPSMAAGPSTAADPSAARIDAALLVEGVAASPLYEGTALVYSRAPGAHAVYQFAAWSAPPARRIAQLAMRRLSARARFDTVAQTDAGIRGALLLRITVERVVHTLDPASGRARLELTAELIDWHRRTLLGRQGFAAHEAVGSDDAAAAVAAFDRGLTRVLDDLAPWVETTAARWSRR